MGITFHCKYCGKKIEAPDKAGGKWGKCPACHKKLYVPNLDSDEELKLAPVDERDEEKRRQLMNETFQITQEILREREIPNGQAESATPASKVSNERLTTNIIGYLRRMADGELQQAEEIANSIIPCGDRAVKILDRIALSEIPEPELADIAQQVLAGLIRTLRSRIS